MMMSTTTNNNHHNHHHGAIERAPGEQLLHEAILHGEDAPRRRALSQAITLLESTRADHREQADRLLTQLLPHTGRAFRLGISGVPGVGKSTFIEALGLFLIGQGMRVAVLAVDPSSSLSGGSILGDKTRMTQLSVHPQAYIRPSPSRGTLGGVAAKTREALLVCEAAGHDVVIVETVGVGQSEMAVAGMVDMYCWLQLPHAGDELQAIKRGVMELVDLVAINKADLDPGAAMRARAQITSSLRLLRRSGPDGDEGDHDEAANEVWRPQVIEMSALKGVGIEGFWHQAQRYRELQTAHGRWADRRRRQALSWMWDTVHAELQQRFQAHQAVRAVLPQILEQVASGQLAASTAARQLLHCFIAN